MRRLSYPWRRRSRGGVRLTYPIEVRMHDVPHVHPQSCDFLVEDTLDLRNATRWRQSTCPRLDTSHTTIPEPACTGGHRGR